MDENIVAVGGCVMRLQELYYKYNPINSLKSNIQQLNGWGTLVTHDKDISTRLTYLYNNLLRLNTAQIKIHSEGLINSLKEYSTSIEAFIKNNGDNALVIKERFDTWGIHWVLNSLTHSKPVEDLDFAELYGLPFTDEYRQEQLNLREEIFYIYPEDMDEEELEGLEEYKYFSLYMSNEDHEFL